jgi:hypothetical protein
MGCPAQSIPPVARFPQLPIFSVTTSYGRIDFLLERGRVDWERLHGGATAIPVADTRVLVAAAEDAWALRREFKT